MSMKIKKLLAFIFSIYLLAFNIGVGLAASDGDKRSVAMPRGSPVNILDISVFESGTTIIPKSLIPQEEYDIKVRVSDNDGIGNSNGGLDGLIIKLWYDNNGDDSVLSDSYKNILDSKTVENPREIVEIKWVRNGVASLAGGTTWKINLEKCKLPDSKDAMEKTYEFVINIKIGKVAREASFTNRWQIAAIASDVDGFSDYMMYKSSSGIGLPMDFYCEIMMDTSIIDGKIEDEDIISKCNEIDYISNAKYDKYLKTDNLIINAIDDENNIAQTDFELKLNSINDFDSGDLVDLSMTFRYLEKNIPASVLEQPISENSYVLIKINKPEVNRIECHGTINYGIINKLY